MFRALYCQMMVVLVIVLAPGTAAPAQDVEPDHIRGQITHVEPSSIVVKTREGKTVRLGLADDLTVIALAKGSFTDVDFGTYVGSVAVKLDINSPIVRAIPRDSPSMLHLALELRIIDEQLRGIALGYKSWDLPPGSTISHGWVDDIEVRVLSIKYGPTEDEETDVEIPREVPILKMSLGDKSLIKPGVHIIAGANKGANGKYMAGFIFIGKDGIDPPL